MIVASMTNLGKRLAKVFPESKVTPRFLTSSVENRISKMLGWKFLYKGLSSILITNDDEFCFLWVKFQFHTIHPLLNISKLSKTGIKVPLVKCWKYFSVVGIQMVDDMEIMLLRGVV